MAGLLLVLGTVCGALLQTAHWNIKERVIEKRDASRSCRLTKRSVSESCSSWERCSRLGVRAAHTLSWTRIRLQPFEHKALVGNELQLRWVLVSELSIASPRRFQNSGKGFLNLGSR